MNSYRPATSGEHLFQYIYKELKKQGGWGNWINALRPLGECEQIGSYYLHHASLVLTCKLVAAGRSLTQMEDENSSQVDPIILRFPWNRLNSAGRLSRLLVKAIQNSGRPISDGAKREMISFAKSRHPHCYICGTELQFSCRLDRNYCTVEHLWPSSFGGDSIENNLLPACLDCNTKKGNIVTWVSTDIHALFLGLDPSPESLSKINFAHRYALYHQAAMSHAIEFECTLRNAFLRIGPWIEAYSIDGDCPTDMFVLKTHKITN